MLDHVTFCDGMTTDWPGSGSVIVRVHEPDGDPSTLRLDIDGGRIAATAADGSPDVELDAVTWATLACGHTPAAELARAGVLDADEAAVRTLTAFSAGRAPWCNEYF